jgi:hypothetical protein
MAIDINVFLDGKKDEIYKYEKRNKIQISPQQESGAKFKG